VLTEDLPVLYEGLSWQQHNDARNGLQSGVASTYFPNALFATFLTSPAFDFSHCTNKPFVATLQTTLRQKTHKIICLSISLNIRRIKKV
jgi:hypothetical protein